MRRIHDGLIGELEVHAGILQFNGVWVRPRRPGQTEMQYQVRNWYYFTWLSGDHIVEQHVHDLDVGNWIAQGHPVEAKGMGGRQVRMGKDVGEIFDHHAVEFTYADGAEDVQLLPPHPRLLGAFSETPTDQGRRRLSRAGSSVLRRRPRAVRWKRPDGHQ